MPKRFLNLILNLLRDAILANVAFALGYYVRYDLQLFRPVLDANRAPYTAYLPFQLGYVALLLLFLAMAGVYTPRRWGSWFDELYRVANATMTVGVILTVVTFIVLPLVYSRLLILEAAFLTLALLGGARLAERIIRAELRRRGFGVDRLLIVGVGELGRAVMRTLVARPDLGYQIIGFVDDDPAKGDLGRYKSLGGLDNLEALLKTERADEVIITLPWMYQRKVIGLVRACESLGVRARVVPDIFQLSLNRVDFDDIGGIPLIGIKEATIPRAGRLVKRALDTTLAALGLIVGLPLFLIIALVIRLESPGPVFFRQIRVGQGEKPFSIYKFRSMHDGAEGQQAQLKELNQASGPLFKIKGDPRLTNFGGFLRQTSLDELPQLINVLRGEMSLVGPRPGLPHEVAQYQPWQRQRLEVSPGMTGLWQVSGRSGLSFDEMCLLDIYYIENWSLGLDWIILLRTIPHVLFGSGAY